MQTNSNRDTSKPTKKLANRTFGLIFSAIFSLVALFPLISGNPLRLWAMILCVVFLLVSLALPALLTPLNQAWAKFGLLMHKITNPILMGLVFFLTVFPTGLILKLLGKDPMKRKQDASANSYWIMREQSKIEPSSFDQQF